MSKNEDLTAKSVLVDSVLVAQCDDNEYKAIFSLAHVTHIYVVDQCFRHAYERKDQHINHFKSILREEYYVQFLYMDKLNKDETIKLCEQMKQLNREINDENLLLEIAFAQACKIDMIITKNPQKYPKIDGLKIDKPSQVSTDKQDKSSHSNLQTRIDKTTSNQPSRSRLLSLTKIQKFPLMVIALGGVLGSGLGVFLIINNSQRENTPNKSHSKFRFSCVKPNVESSDSFPMLIPSNPAKFPRITFWYDSNTLDSLRQATKNCNQQKKQVEWVFSHNITSIGFEVSPEGKFMVCGREKGNPNCDPDKIILQIPQTANVEKYGEEIQHKFQCFNNDSCQHIKPITLYLTDDIRF